jgi:hypothetical protein
MNQHLKSDGTPYKHRKYTSFASGENEWRSLEEVGKIIGVTKNRISQIVDGALIKVADSVLREIHGRKPRADELERLSRDESFQTVVAEELAATLSTQDQSDREA